MFKLVYWEFLLYNRPNINFPMFIKIMLSENTHSQHVCLNLYSFGWAYKWHQITLRHHKIHYVTSKHYFTSKHLPSLLHQKTLLHQDPA